MVYKVSEDLLDRQRLGCLRAISHMVQMCDVVQPVLVSQHPCERLSLMFVKTIVSSFICLKQLH